VLLGRRVTSFALQTIDRSIGEFPVLGITRYIKKHVAFRLVRVSRIDQCPGKGNDLVHGLGGPWHRVDLINAQTGEIREVVRRVLGSHFRHRDSTLPRFLD